MKLCRHGYIPAFCADCSPSEPLSSAGWRPDKSTVVVVVIAILALIFLGGCGKNYDPQGKVTGRKFEREHYETHYHEEWDGQQCLPETGYDMNGNLTTTIRCRDQYTTVPHQHFVQDKWFLKVRRCEIEKPESCDTDEFEVDEDTYKDAEKGFLYNVDTEELIPQ